MTDAYTGEIRYFAGTFAPRNWAFCAGALLDINTYGALYSILGTAYGGNGITSFGLPDMRGRVGVGAGTGPGLTPRLLGQKFGIETETLTAGTMPAHTHAVASYDPIAYRYASDVQGDVDTPTAGAYLADKYFATDSEDLLGYHPNDAGADPQYLNDTSITGQESSDPAGVPSPSPMDMRMPYQAVNCIICLQGIYPPRN